MSDANIGDEPTIRITWPSRDDTVRVTRKELAAATRQRIVEGAHQLLLDQPYEDVTLAGIAAAASVSHQTVLNHFESKDGVILAVLDVLQRQTEAMLSRPHPGDVKGAVKAIVRKYERVGDIVVGWSSNAQRSEVLEQAILDRRDSHQKWLEEMFAEWLPANDTVARRRTITGLYAATDVYVWKLLRRDLRRSRAATEDVMADLVFGALKGPYP